MTTVIVEVVSTPLWRTGLGRLKHVLPQFRGKQFKLITIREMAPSTAASGFVPIIDPVRVAAKGLETCAHRDMQLLRGKAIVIFTRPTWTMPNGQLHGTA